MDEEISLIEIATVFDPPILLNFVDEISCPRCDMDVDVKDLIIDEDSFVICENCEHKIKFKLIKI